MAEPYLGEIRIFSSDFAPLNWASCNGQLLPIHQNEDLYGLIATTYGGDGLTTFALPNMQSRIPVGEGRGPGLSMWYLGDVKGEETATITEEQIGNHEHEIHVSTNAEGLSDPEDKVLAQSAGGAKLYGHKRSLVPMHNQSIENAKGAQAAHENRMPLLSVHYIICIKGVYPERNQED